MRSLILQPSGCNVGIRTTTPISTLSVAGSSEKLAAGAEYAPFGIYRAGTEKALLAGYHSTQDYAYLQSLERNITVRSLILQAIWWQRRHRDDDTRVQANSSRSHCKHNRGVQIPRWNCANYSYASRTSRKCRTSRTSRTCGDYERCLRGRPASVLGRADMRLSRWQADFHSPIPVSCDRRHRDL